MSRVGGYLSMSVLAGLRGGHLHNFAGTPLQNHVAVLAQSGALHGVGGGGARLTSLEIKIGICHGAMGLGRCGDMSTSIKRSTESKVRLPQQLRRHPATPVVIWMMDSCLQWGCHGGTGGGTKLWDSSALSGAATS